MKISMKIIGIMRNLLIYGFEKSGDQTDARTFFDVAVRHFQDFYQLCRCHEFKDLMIDNNLHGPIEGELLHYVAKLIKFFTTYASERPFEFLLMPAAPVVVSSFVQICQHEADQFNKPSEESDEVKLAVLGKVVIGGISTIRSLLKPVSDPKVIDKGMSP